jgi:hypothetical protein
MDNQYHQVEVIKYQGVAGVNNWQLKKRLEDMTKHAPKYLNIKQNNKK